LPDRPSPPQDRTLTTPGPQGSSPPSSDFAGAFPPGMVFAERYRIVSPIGRRIGLVVFILTARKPCGFSRNRAAHSATTVLSSMSRGSVFAAEVGEPHGRREFNTLGDAVNTAARLMNRAEPDQILLTGAVHNEIESWFQCEPYGAVELKGKTIPTQLFGLLGKH